MLLTPQAIRAQGQQDGAQPVYVLLQTNKGDITLELNAQRAPVTVKNFVEYVESGHFKDTLFHRVMKGFMIQGGGFSAKDTKEKETRDPIKNESNNGLQNQKYTIAMARTPSPNSATAQFFINTVDNSMKLDRKFAGDGFGYAVFGKVIKGQEVVDEIESVATGRKRIGFTPHDDWPKDPVIITEAKVIDKPE
jgi:peptidyl-prolyl cis-trans isomerase B (cyclophilin B)